MLIIYEEEDLSTLGFIEYCKRNSYNFVALTIQDLTSDQFSFFDTNSKCTWYINDNQICFDNLSGIYIRSTNFLDKFFIGDYKEVDITYVKKEWWSYLVYRMWNFHNCINPITLELLSYRVCEGPFFWNISSNLGFKIPEYIFSGSCTELKNIFFGKNGKKYITLNSLIFNNSFSIAQNVSEDVIGLVEHINGRFLIVHIIDNDIFSCVREEHKNFSTDLSATEKSRCIAIARKLNLRVAQIIFIEQKNTMQKFFMSLSPYPDWYLNHEDNIDSIYKSLLKILLCQ